MKSILYIGIIVIAIIAYLAYRSYTPKNTNTPTSAVQTSSVSIQNMSFNPASISVSPGTTVTFTNNDSVSHTVTADDNSFDSGTLPPGKTYSKTFDKAGTFAYHCSIHPSMTGSVQVK